MKFICNGTLIGFTVALDDYDQVGDYYPEIQVWRTNDHPYNCYSLYHRADRSIPVNLTACVSRLTEVSNRVFHCVLNESWQVSIQERDIIGIELPPMENASSAIYFAKVPNVPTSYVFEGIKPTSQLVLSNNNMLLNKALPQITFDVFPGIYNSYMHRR